MIEPQPEEPANRPANQSDPITAALAAAWRISRAVQRDDVWREAVDFLHGRSGLTVACYEADGRELLTLAPGFPEPEASAAIIEVVETAWFATSRPVMLSIPAAHAIAAACTDADCLRGAIALIGDADTPMPPEEAKALALTAFACGQAFGALALRATTVPLLRHEAELERLRIEFSHALHSGPAQDLAMANMAIEHLIATAASDADPTEDSRLALDYVARAVQSLRQFIAQMRDGEGPIEPPGPAPSPMPTFPESAQEEAALAITREALRNSRKHAGAERITITIDRNHDGIDVAITDDGRGFSGQERPGHFGLRQMRETAERAGGNLAIESSPGSGATVRFNSPRQQRHAQERSTRRSAPANLESGTDDHA